MRPSRMPIGLAMLLTCGWHMPAQEVHYTATVVAPEAEVRSGPSASMYATNKLRQGEVVEVVRDEGNGWLAVKPPPGSFSWICTRFLRALDQRTWLVVTHDETRVPVLVGSNLIDDKPTVEKAQLARGAQVIAAGPPAKPKGEQTTWLPIVPPPNEVRYVRADAVKRGTAPPPLVATQTVAPPLAPASAPPPAVPPAGLQWRTTPGTAAGEPLEQAALNAERAGNSAEAIRHYGQLVQQTRNEEVRLRALNRLQYLRDGPREAGNARLASAPAGPFSGVPAMTIQGRGSGPAPGQTASYPPPQANAARRTERGCLRRTAFFMENGVPAFALHNSREELMMYVTAGPGVNLAAHANQAVDLEGTVAPRLLHKNIHLVVTQVRPLQ